MSPFEKGDSVATFTLSLNTWPELCNPMLHLLIPGGFLIEQSFLHRPIAMPLGNGFALLFSGHVGYGDFEVAGTLVFLQGRRRPD